MTVLKEIYYGNIQGSEYEHSKQWNEVRKTLLAEWEVLDATLTLEQKEQLEKCLEKQTELSSLEREELYTYAMAVGIGLGYESKHKGNE